MDHSKVLNIYIYTSNITFTITQNVVGKIKIEIVYKKK